MNSLYIGILTAGTTSRSRYEALTSVTQDWCWSALDTDIAFRSAPSWARSLAFRLRLGPAVRAVNRAVSDALAGDKYDLIWVDKGVLLWPVTVDRLRQCADRLVHYTPDTAFVDNRSRHFRASAAAYDLLITTKLFELGHYEQIIPGDRLYLTTQSYDSDLLSPRCQFEEKRLETVFIGLCEPDREACLEELLGAEIPVRLGGMGWNRFLKKHGGNSLLSFQAERIFGLDYAIALSRASVGLGLVSKRFPELHTTRTFEIPACGTALATERNRQTESFFEDAEVLFYEDYSALAARLKAMLEEPETLRRIALSGHQRVASAGFDNRTVMSKILGRLGLL